MSSSSPQPQPRPDPPDRQAARELSARSLPQEIEPDARAAHGALEGLAAGTSAPLSSALLKALRGAEAIEIYSDAELAQFKRELEALPELERHLATCERRAQEVGWEAAKKSIFVTALRRCLSLLDVRPSDASDQELERIFKMREELADKHERIRESSEYYRARIESLEELERKLGKASSQDGGTICLTSRGEKLRADLALAVPRAGGEPLGSVLTQIEQLQDLSTRAISRVMGMYGYLLKMGYGGCSNVMDCATIMGLSDGSFRKLYSRFSRLVAQIEKAGLEAHHALLPAAKASVHGGEITDLGEQLALAGDLASGRRSKNSSKIWLAAAEALPIAADQREIRLDALGKLLWPREWGKLSDDPDKFRLAARAARYKAEPAIIGKAYVNLRDEMMRVSTNPDFTCALRGRHSEHWNNFGTEAILELLGHRGKVQDSAARFNLALLELSKHGMPVKTHLDPCLTAARVARLPGSIAENVEWIDRIYQRLEKMDLDSGDGASRALKIFERVRPQALGR